MNEQDKRVQAWMQSWLDDPATGAWRRLVAGAMARLLKALPVPLEQVTPELLQDCAGKITDSWAFRERVLTSTRCFIGYCGDKGWIKTAPRLRRNGLGTFRDLPLPESLRAQVESVLARHRNRKTGNPLKPNVLKAVKADFEAFYSVVAKAHPQRRLAALEDFAARDLEVYQQTIEARGSLYRDRPLSPTTVKSNISYVMMVFGAAKKILGWPANPMDAYEVPQYAHVQRDAYLTKAEVAAVCAAEAKGRTLRERFLAARNMAMAAVQYDPALRPEEVVKLLDQELLWNRMSKGGLLPFIIRGAKARPDGHEELFSLTPPAVEAVRRYLEIRQRYCAQEKVAIVPVKDPKSHRDLGTPLFITADGRAMKPVTYEGNFRALARLAGLDPKITSYALRHSRISHWLEDGVPIDRVSRLARHRDVNFTMKHYAHYLPGSDRAILEGIYGAKPKVEPILTKDILPERPVLRQILKAAAELLGVPLECARIDQVEEALAERVQGRKGRDELCYSVIEAMDKLQRGRTQIYDWMRKGYIHPVELPNGRKGLPKDEIDRLAALRTSKEAAIILGYREKTPTTIQRNVRDGFLRATQLGNDYLFSDRDLAEFLLWKNGHKRLLGTRPQHPRAQFGVKAEGGQSHA